MSGGYFDYVQSRMYEVCEELADVIENNYSDRDSGYSEETISKFREGLTYLKLATVYLNRIDYLLEADDGEESFHRRLEEELADLVKLGVMI